MDTLTLNEALKAHIELVADIDLDKLNVSSDERGLFIEDKFHKIMGIVRSMTNIDSITEESILNMYSMCVDFEDCFVSFIKKED